MLIVFLIVLPIFSNAQKVFDQKDFFKSKEIVHLTNLLTNFENGSGFSLLYFESNKRKRQVNILFFSSNTKTKMLVDSFFLINPMQLIGKINKSQSFILPIIQIMYDDEKNIQGCSLNWNNNTFEQLSEFRKMNKLPKSAVLINPLIVYGSPPIQKKVNN
jgi:hypothetical protein